MVKILLVVIWLFITRLKVFNIRFLYFIKAFRVNILDKLDIKNVIGDVVTDIILYRFICFVFKLPLVETYNVKINKYTNKKNKDTNMQKHKYIRVYA